MRISRVVKSVAAAVALTAGSSAWAIPSLTVGAVDNLLTSANLADNGKATEEAWVASVLGFDVYIAERLDAGLGEISAELVDGTAQTYAQYLASPTDYFIVKTGNGSVTDADGNGAGDRWFLFENVGNPFYAVFDLAALGFPARVDIVKVSHVTQIRTEDVPAPAAAMLFGLGLAGLGVASRRRKI